MNSRMLGWLLTPLTCPLKDLGWYTQVLVEELGYTIGFLEKQEGDAKVVMKLLK